MLNVSDSKLSWVGAMKAQLLEEILDKDVG